MVVGSDGAVGAALSAHLLALGVSVYRTTRRIGQQDGKMHLELTEPVGSLPEVDVIFFCAGVARFIDCETQEAAYRVNVDAPMEIARSMPRGLFVFLSSDAVQKALHTNYGMHKALAEMGLRALPRAAVVRLGRVQQDDLPQLCERLAVIGAQGKAGLFMWRSGTEKPACATQ